MLFYECLNNCLEWTRKFLKAGTSSVSDGACLSVEYWIGSGFRYNHLRSHTVCVFQHTQQKMSQKLIPNVQSKEAIYTSWKTLAATLD